MATHKKYSFPKDNLYIPLHVGKKNSNILLNYIGDDTGDSISELNDSFCELTGLYWLWKNSDSPIVGLVHYRRYFSYHKKITNVNYQPIASSKDFHELNKGYDIIVPTKMKFGRNLTVKEHYALVHKEEDIYLIRDIIKSRCPSYLNAFDTVMNEKEMFICNMFISKNHIMKEYAEWLFDILFEAKIKIDTTVYDNYQKRVFGFISERLFNIWIEKNKDRLKIANRRIIEINENLKRPKIIKYYILKIKSTLSILKPQ
ncbi:DUF4422 domain-containing protein [Brenneria goodwinii]|uniref:DUF4422 domain-containing protein n=1 Tax=Brenneria goodwinii TaxID=1109412 RepID=UPI0036E4A3E6